MTTADSTPLTKVPLAEIVAAIEDDIVTGRRRPGERLDEKELSIRFGVSRTPIREVLNRIAASGMVESRPHQGMFVSRITLPQLLQMYEVMSELEGLCARLAARRMEPDERRQLAAVQEAGARIVSADDEAAYTQHNIDLHELIYAGTHNEYLIATIRALRRRLEPYRRLSFQIKRRLGESHVEHGRIVRLVADGDGEAAALEMRTHMDIQRRNFSDYIVLLTRALSPS